MPFELTPINDLELSKTDYTSDAWDVICGLFKEVPFMTTKITIPSGTKIIVYRD